MAILLGIFTAALFFLSLIIVGLVLMQRSSSGGGLGAAMGGGAAEQALGAETNTILTKWTQFGVIGFFALAFFLYLGHQYNYAEEVNKVEGNRLQELVPAMTEEEEAEAEATPAEPDLFDVGEGAATETAPEGAETTTTVIEAPAETEQNTPPATQ